MAQKEQALDTIAERPLEQHMLVLGGRATLEVPEGSVNEARQRGIMSAPPSQDSETRLLLDLGDDRLVIFCQDLQALGTRTLMQDWRDMMDPEGAMGMKFKKVGRDRGPEVIAYAPAEPEVDQEIVFLKGVLVQLADGTLIRMDAYINGPAQRRQEAYATLVDRIFSTVSEGPEPLDMGARTVVLTPWEGRDSLVVDVPAGHIVAREDGADFDVVRISRITSLTSVAKPMMVVYIGYHPRRFALEFEMDPSVMKKEGGQMMNREMEWESHVDPDGALWLMESIQEIPTPGTGLARQLHVALIGTAAEDMEAMRSIAATVRVR